MNTDSVHLFGKSKKGDNPFNCYGSLAVATNNCRVQRFNQKEVTYEYSKCNAPKHIEKKQNEHKVGMPTFSNISHHQEKILKEKGYDGKITIPCPVSTLLPIDLTDNSHVDTARKVDTSITCNNPCQHEIIVTSTSAPWILNFVCDPTCGIISDPTGVDSLSSLQHSVTFGGYHYSLAAVLFADGGHFCSIVVDPNPGGDLSIFYDGMKQ
jgi:hypothetical protein